MFVSVFLVAAALAQTTCLTACATGEKCVEACANVFRCLADGALFTCGAQSLSCSLDCNGSPPPVLTTTPCWNGEILRPRCDQGLCRWASSTCPVNPCDPSPCKPDERCCVPTATRPCATLDVPLAAGISHVCIPPADCQCLATGAPAAPTTTCSDGSLAGPYCRRTVATGAIAATCSWQTRTCPVDPCKPSPCAVGQTCSATVVSLGTTVTAAFTCTPTVDRCAGVVCAGIGKCVNGACVCDATLATRARTQCSDGQTTPLFNNDPQICQYVERPCADVKVPPTCTGTDSVINVGTAPQCVPSTHPCVSPVPVTCDRGLTCAPSTTDSAKPVCVCTKCPPNDIPIFRCPSNNEESQICDLSICQYVPNPKCNAPDPCTSACPDRCVNMGAGIAAPPICVPRDPCSPNPCAANTVCKAAIDVSATAAATGSFTGASPYICVRLTPSTTCEPNPCANGGLCSLSNGAPVCRCQKGWTGKLCLSLDCEVCYQTDTKQCSTPNSVLSTDGTTVRESCVCDEARISGVACNTAQSGTDGRVSPQLIVPTNDKNLDGRVSVTGSVGTSFRIQGGSLDSGRTTTFRGEPIVVEIDRLNADGTSKPGPLDKGDYAWIQICSSTFVETKAPVLFLVDSTGMRNSVDVCAEINVGVTLPRKSFTSPCWKYPVCHASTYAAGTPAEASSAPFFGMSIVTFLGFLVL
jgi:hypothetical protein